MKTFHLQIFSPDRVFFDGECRSLIMPTGDGMMGVMANHTPFTASIADGEVKFTKPDGEVVICAVMQGMVDVTDNRVRLLCESALAPDEIDAEAERRAAEEALLAMKRKQSQREFALWQLSFQKAVNHLRIKDKKVNL